MTCVQLFRAPAVSPFRIAQEEYALEKKEVELKLYLYSYLKVKLISLLETYFLFKRKVEIGPSINY